MPIEITKTKSNILEGFTDSVMPECAAWIGFETKEYRQDETGDGYQTI
jgi:hypothetical protein